MRHLFLLLFLLPLSFVANGQPQKATGYDVRQVRWWMSKQQVIAAEKRKPSEQDRERVVFKRVKVGDDYANLLYEFNSDKLVSLTYTFTELGGVLYLPYISYSAIDRKITERYGEPVETKERWRGDKNAYKPIVGYSDAVVKGDLILITTWLNGRTEISHVMNKEVHGLSYVSRLTPKPASESTKDF